MSVPKYRRNESPMQFLDTARELEIYTIQRCANFPKRYMFLITKELIDLSRSIYNNVKSANSVYPTNREESQIRVNFLIQAVCDLQCLASQLDIAKGIVQHNEKDKPIKPTVWEEWARLHSSSHTHWVRKELSPSNHFPTSHRCCAMPVCAHRQTKYTRK